jgi:hypothetical protein
MAAVSFSAMLSAQDAPSRAKGDRSTVIALPAIPHPQVTDPVANKSSFGGGQYLVLQTAALALPEISSVISAPPSSDGSRRITLEEAQQQAAQAANPMARLGQLSVEAAKQHRLGAEAD